MRNPPRILAIETSGRVGSVCVAAGPTVLARAELQTDARHASGLHAAIERVVAGQNWAPDGLDEVYVSGGPGSFTGLRIGITVARTLGWATGARVVRVPTVDALAWNGLRAEAAPSVLAVLLDAKRAQVYAAAFLLRDDARGPTYEKVVPEAMTEPYLFLRDTVERLAQGDVSRVAVLGEGVAYHRPAIDRAGVRVLPESLWPARAEGVHAIGLRMAVAGEYCPLDRCLPIYIRLPEPEEKWLQRQGTPPAGPHGPGSVGRAG